MGDARATAGWVPSGAREIEGMASAGWLTEDEEREVRETLELVTRSAHRGEISVTFANWLITKLAEERAEAWRARNGR